MRGLGIRTTAQLIGDGTETIISRPGFCQCGCGRLTSIATRTRSDVGDVAGAPRRFFGNHGHRPLARKALFLSASNGRTYIPTRDGGREYWCRVVARNILGRDLLAGEIVHHINGDHTDDRPENLAVVTRADHPRVHYATVPMPVEALA